jgi:hypothetical protein
VGLEYSRPYFCAWPAPARSAPARANFSLYHTCQLFVNRKLAQIFIYFYPKICASFLKILLAFPLAIPYNNTCKEQTTANNSKGDR